MFGHYRRRRRREPSERREELRNLAAFCHFYRLSPRQVDELTLEEYEAMIEHLQEYAEAVSRA